jgi:hypothetical protein
MAFAVETNSVVAGLVVSTVLGAGFGIGLVSGLLEVQRIAPPADLAKLTGAFYAVAYTGFAVPTLLAALTPPFTTIALLLILACMVSISMVAVLWGSRKHLPHS